MLRTPKGKNAARHSAHCTCRGCSHEDAQFFKKLNGPRHRDDRWQAVDLKRAEQQPEHHQPERPARDFDTDMAALLERIRGGGR